MSYSSIHIFRKNSHTSQLNWGTHHIWDPCYVCKYVWKDTDHTLCWVDLFNHYMESSLIISEFFINGLNSYLLFISFSIWFWSLVFSFMLTCWGTLGSMEELTIFLLLLKSCFRPVYVSSINICKFSVTNGSYISETTCYDKIKAIVCSRFALQGQSKKNFTHMFGYIVLMIKFDTFNGFQHYGVIK